MANPNGQSFVYSNSVKLCNESLLSHLEAPRDRLSKEISHTPDGELKEFQFHALTGACEIMLKSYLVAEFCGEDVVSSLRRIWSMQCTSASECRLSSKRCAKCQWHVTISRSDTPKRTLILRVRDGQMNLSTHNVSVGRVDAKMILTTVHLI